MALLLPLCLLLLVGCDGDDTEVVDEEEGAEVGLEVTALAADELPEGVSEATLTIEDGEFDDDQLVVQVNEPVVLSIINQDADDYLFTIGDLVQLFEIPAGEAVEVEFTVPEEEAYEGELVAAETEEVVDTIEVEIQDPGGIEP